MGEADFQIAVTNLTKRYGPRLVLDRVSLSIHQGKRWL